MNTIVNITAVRSQTHWRPSNTITTAATTPPPATASMKVGGGSPQNSCGKYVPRHLRVQATTTPLSTEFTSTWDLSGEKCTLRCTAEGNPVFNEFAKEVRSIRHQWLSENGLHRLRVTHADSMDLERRDLVQAIAVDRQKKQRRDDAFSCEVLTEKTTATTIVIKATTYVVNTIDEGIASGDITPSSAMRAASVYSDISLGSKRDFVWPSWLQKGAVMEKGFSEKHVAAAIASTRQLTFTREEGGGISLVADHVSPPTLVDVQLSKEFLIDNVDAFFDNLFRGSLPLSPQEEFDRASEALKKRTKASAVLDMRSPRDLEELEWQWLRAVADNRLEAIDDADRVLILSMICGLIIRRKGLQVAPLRDAVPHSLDGSPDDDNNKQGDKEEEEERLQFDNHQIDTSSAITAAIVVKVRKPTARIAGGASNQYAFAAIGAMKDITREAAELAFDQLQLEGQSLRMWQVNLDADPNLMRIDEATRRRTLPNKLTPNAAIDATPTCDEIQRLCHEHDLPIYREFLKANGIGFNVTYFPEGPVAAAEGRKPVNPEYTTPLRTFLSFYHQLILLLAMREDSAVGVRRAAFWKDLKHALQFSTPEGFANRLSEKRAAHQYAEKRLKCVKQEAARQACPTMLYPSEGIVVKNNDGRFQLYVNDLQLAVRTNDGTFTPTLVPIPHADQEKYQHNEVVRVIVGGAGKATIGDFDAEKHKTFWDQKARAQRKAP